MFRINLIILTNLISNFVFVSSKCVFEPSTQQLNYVECKNVRSMQDLVDDMRSNWHRLKIINDVDAVFFNAEHLNPYLQYIQHLDLSEVGTLHTTDYGFRDFSQLNQLNISNTQTMLLNDYWFSSENNIKVLDVSWNKLTELRRESFRTLKSLQTANFSHNSIENIEKFAVSDLKRLRHLDLRNNQLNHLTDWGDHLSMEVLNLDGNVLAKLNSGVFRGLSALHTLTISENSIVDLEKDCFSGLQKLQKLNLSSNIIKTIPNNLFREFSNVQLLELDLSNNAMSNLPPKSFENLKFLQFFDLSWNNIKSIDENTFVGLSSLRKLLLNHNNMLHIQPDTFARLERIDALDLSGNWLETFSGDVFGTRAKKLRKLFLKGNRLVKIQSHAFDTIPNVDFLVLTDNAITNLDDGLLLPLTNLKKFHVNRNRIEELSGSLFNTTELIQELYIDHNKLTYFPETTNSFKNMLKISLEGNPWQCECFKEIMQWVKKGEINYSPFVSKKYYDGSRPICVVTQFDGCVKNIDSTEKRQIIAIYEAAFK